MNYNMSSLQYISQHLQHQKGTGNYRTLKNVRQQGKWVWQEDVRMLNLSSNDYLGLASDSELQAAFFRSTDLETARLSASSSRLLCGNFSSHEKLEQQLATLFGAESALLFNSGYHANIGILPAICDKQTIILADKLVHASIIDGIRLSNATSVRFRHNDYEHLENLIKKYAEQCQRIVVVTESVFSMDGDLADLPLLAALKHRYPNVLLYVDEAHAVGVRGENGLGVAEETNTLGEIDFLVGTFGKAVASMGAYVICKNEIRDYLINTMRSFIFSTALPPFLCDWTTFVLKNLPAQNAKRQHLQMISARMKEIVEKTGIACPSQSNIVPFVVGCSKKAVEIAEELQQHGFYALAVRPPTVPEGSARIRFSLTANMDFSDVERLEAVLFDIIKKYPIG